MNAFKKGDTFPLHKILFALAGLPIMAFCLLLQGQEKAAPLALRDGDRVVFYGDSITAQRLYTRFAEDVVVSRYPKLHISFYNAGVSGDTVSGGHAGDMATRIKRDVVPLRPTVVTIMLGMNDGRYTAEYDVNFNAYANGYRKLIATLRESVPGVRIFLICPSPYDEVGHPSAIAGYNTVMRRYGQFLATLGKEENVPVIDFNRPITNAIGVGIAIDPQLAGALLPDRIHPAPAGHWIMADAMAAGWHVDPVISSVVIRVPDGKVEEAYNASVTEVRVEQGRIAWKQMDGALPLPLELNDPFTGFLFKVSDLERMDRQLLHLNGLAMPRYTLSIDGQKVGSFTREELSEGINLATLQTPMEQQAKAIDWAADDRAKLSGTRFNLLTENAAIPSRQEALAALDALDHRMIALEYENAQPKAHVFELDAESH